jgi:hypothetical protein
MKTKPFVYNQEGLRLGLREQIPGFETASLKIEEYRSENWGHPFLVAFLPYPYDRHILGRAFGRAYYYTNITLIRDELPKGAKETTINHELGHLIGFGQVNFDIPHLTPWINELGAHAFSLIKDPVNFVAAVAVTMNSPERRAFYFDRVRTGDVVEK